MGGISDPFAGFGPAAKAKLVVLGPLGAVSGQFRSLNLEHVSPAHLKAPGISRRPAHAAAEEAATLALMRRWFFARKPDAGFVLTDFPATLLQARVFDEWLDARNEVLTGVIAAAPTGCSEPVLEHYRTLGLLLSPGDLAPAVSRPVCR
jgi:adenylate kinase